MKRRFIVLFFLVTIPFLSFQLPPIKAPPSITYNSVTNIITVVGFTQISPCTFVDIYNADVSGSWGVVTKQSTSQYLFECKLIIGDGSTETHFADSKVQVIFGVNCTSANGGRIFWVKANAYVTLGELVNATTKASTDGVSLVIAGTGYQFHTLMWVDNNARGYFYSCQFINLNESARLYCGFRGNSSDYSRLWNSQFNNLDSNWLGYIDIYNVVITDAKVQSLASAAMSVRYDLNADDVKVYDCEVVFSPAPNAPFVITNVYARHNAYIIRGYKTVSATSNRPQLINVDSDVWDIHWVSNSLSYINHIYRQYEFDLNVTDSAGTPIQNANVTVSHYGQSGGQDFTVLTGANGSFSTRTLTMGFYNYSTGNTLNNYNPYNITITCSGYQTYTKNFTLSEQIDWKIALIDESEAGYAGFVFSFFGLVIGFVIGALVGFGSKK